MNLVRAARVRQAAAKIEPEPPEIIGVDSASIYVDTKTGRAQRVEDLPPDLRRTVEEAIARPVEPTAPLEMLKEASLVLWPHIRSLHEADRDAITMAVARGLYALDARLRVEVATRYCPPLTLERGAALACPACLPFEHPAALPQDLARDLAQASISARDALVQRFGHVAVIRAQDALAQHRMQISRGIEPPPPPGPGGKGEQKFGFT